MKKEEAIKIVHDATKGGFVESFVNALEALGLIKFDKEKTPYDLIQQVVGNDFNRDIAGLVIDHLYVHGYEIRKVK